MAGHKIFFSNIGYARGIDGTLWQHILYAHRHIYFGMEAQQKVLLKLKEIIALEQPDLCCFVEVDNGSFHSSYYNQIQYLIDHDYVFHDISCKYGTDNWLSELPLFKGRCNAFIAKSVVPFERLYFRHGSKRLIHKITLADGVLLYFTHFSLQKTIRKQQLAEILEMIKTQKTETILLADFNILDGFGELKPLMDDLDLIILNDENDPTFTFHRTRRVLDLCLCSSGIADRVSMRILPQPFSDHAGLLVEYIASPT